MKLQLGATGAKGREWQKAILVLAVILPALIMVLVQLRQYFNLTTNTLLLLIVTVAIAVTSNLWLSILSAIESFLFLNYYFTPPFNGENEHRSKVALLQ